MVHPGGRPRKYNKKEVDDLLVKFEKYIKNTKIPIIVDFCAKNGIIKQTLYDYPEFSTLLKRCTEKKEANLEILTLKGSINAPMAIFSLKQLGWSDKKEVEHSGSLGVTIIDDIPDET